MARRKKSSPAEDIMDLVALAPWWVGVGLAITAFLLLHRVAGLPLVTMAPGSQLAQSMSRAMVVAAAQLGQYVVPMLCLAGAALSAWRRRQRASLVVKVTQSESASALDGMTWQQFEVLVGEAFRLQGFQVIETGGGGADGGVDLVLKRGAETFLVQCKQWRALKVSVQVVRELYGVMAAQGAAGGFVVTSGRFTDDAVAFAHGRNVRLIDGTKLHGLLQQARRATAPQPVRPPVASPAIDVPTCPRCAQRMVQRAARRGANAGQTFWGCQDFPNCKGTRAAT